MEQEYDERSQLDHYDSQLIIRQQLPRPSTDYNSPPAARIVATLRDAQIKLHHDTTTTTQPLPACTCFSCYAQYFEVQPPVYQILATTRNFDHEEFILFQPRIHWWRRAPLLAPGRAAPPCLSCSPRRSERPSRPASARPSPSSSSSPLGGRSLLRRRQWQHFDVLEMFKHVLRTKKRGSMDQLNLQ